MVNRLNGISRRTFISEATSSLVALSMFALPDRVRADMASGDAPKIDAPSGIGTWSPVQPGKAVAIHVALLPNGNVALWQDAGTGAYQSGQTVAYLVKMSPGTLPSLSDWTAIPNNEVDLFCAGQTMLADGRIFVVGGQSGGYYFGIDTATIFDPTTATWINPPGNKMANARWYPSVITLPNGEVLALSGAKQGEGDSNRIPEVWKTGPGGWRELTQASARMNPYPWLSIDPRSGRVFMSGPQAVKFLSTEGSGKLSAGPARNSALRKAGTFAVYGPGRVLAIGGGDSSTYQTAELIDLLGAARWTRTGSMHFGRRYATATALPDGTVLVTGGGENQIGPAGVLPAEIWDPATGDWSIMAPMAEPRLYHSIALLLPDGRVMVGGGGKKSNAIDHPNLEFFSPPYLANGPRPTIGGAPAQVAYGQNFVVQTSDAQSIVKVNIIRLGALTHSVNTSQVFYTAGFTAGAGILNVTAPPNGNFAPPGFYMLFLLNGSGVPSLAAIIKIG